MSEPNERIDHLAEELDRRIMRISQRRLTLERELDEAIRYVEHLVEKIEERTRAL